MRGVRFQLEFAKADDALRAWGVRSTIVVFGSARVREAGGGRQSFWYGEARRLRAYRLGAGRSNAFSGRSAGQCHSHRRRPRDHGGGQPRRRRHRRPSIGFNIALPREQIPNAYSTPELTFRFHYFAMRKMHFAMRANALVVFRAALERSTRCSRS